MRLVSVRRVGACGGLRAAGLLAATCCGIGPGCRPASPPPEAAPALPALHDLAVRAPAPIATPAIEALLARWQAAQNTGDLAAYRTLYADPFFGIRRSGVHVVTFDHAGWMKDRARMFRKPQRLVVSDLAVTSTSPERATVRFTQEWSSGSFRDTGGKELSLRATPTGLLITREEQLRSTVLPTEAEGRFLHLAGGYVVLAKDAAEGWGQGPPQEAPPLPGRVSGDAVVTYRRLRPDKVPARLMGWQGRGVRLFGVSGLLCTGSVAEILPASALYTDGILERDPETQKALSEREVTDSEWDAGRKLLVARIEPTSGDCKGARFARAAELPVPKVSRFEDAQPAWRALGQRLFRKQPIYGEIQAYWERHLASEGFLSADPAGSKLPEGMYRKWDGPDKPLGEWPGRVAVARHPLRDSSILSVVALQATDPDTLIGIAWTAWEVTGEPPSPSVVPLNQPARSRSIEPLAALDIDGDGRLELLNEHGLLSAASEQPLAYARTDYLDLPKVYSCYAGENDWDELLGGPQP